MAELSTYALRLALYLALMLLFGRTLFVRPALPRAAGLALPLIALALVIIDAVTRLSGVLGVAPLDLDHETAHWFLTGTPVGEAGLLRILAVLAMLPLLALDRPLQGLRRWVALVLAATALASLSWNGHAAAGDGLGGVLRQMAGIVHLLAAGAWVGAIAAILQLALRPQGLRLRERTHALWQAAHGFALPGTIIVATLAMTGTYTYVDLGGSAQTLTGTAHGRWLLLKLALVAGMLGLAALHRWRLVPALATSIRGGWQPRPLRALRHSLACESALVLLVLACVAVLGTLDPLA
ncbi:MULTISPECIES: copper homeostasis membrane protein CopD [Stenotrophomonas]|jgi:putative copper resistance protein D|uniref:copper homeostasis membrane protein CopD n=1 Tax=Stenotrophomonas TaxID=40323 RepID=UPI00201D2323|nr:MULTISPECIES: copper homeostasis membrane protein CopD [Stenotrophomonas]MBN5024324.1 copper homeostasis membrane protein CopD [Stenotrophomonas maltophilia]MDH1272218.1 copper homeostasis membrane protein CopD [Stenotrophomonas sp. GD03937]MDH1483472.1 copper homeostasis membrane protein CopD [Stenotrophomonas sp. GD03712]UQY96511.1 copper homeostasis membrane protein CopD [Stenotrophomonas maltophilia]WON66852.1 copper homeostasis membrane protein CopD [Stenotrophomonas maltophilia]